MIVDDELIIDTVRINQNNTQRNIAKALGVSVRRIRRVMEEYDASHPFQPGNDDKMYCDCGRPLESPAGWSSHVPTCPRADTDVTIPQTSDGSVQGTLEDTGTVELDGGSLPDDTPTDSQSTASPDIPDANLYRLTDDLRRNIPTDKGRAIQRTLEANPNATQKEIAEALGTTSADVSYIAKGWVSDHPSLARSESPYICDCGEERDTHGQYRNHAEECPDADLSVTLPAGVTPDSVDGETTDESTDAQRTSEMVTTAYTRIGELCDFDVSSPGEPFTDKQILNILLTLEEYHPDGGK